VGYLGEVKISEVDTPALLIDLDIMERNLQRAADYAAAHYLRLRPHTKTHKIPALARKQLDLGAAGITVAKVGEAEVMQRAQPRDLLVAYPILGESKLKRLAKLAAEIPVTVALDSIEASRQLSKAAQKASVQFGVLLEMDAGLGRVGVSPSELPDLAMQVRTLPNLQIAGFSFYAGHLKPDQNAYRQSLEELGATIRKTADELERAGIHVAIVSGGSTPTLFDSHLIAGLNEIRPGTYIFNDKNTVASGGCSLEDCAAFLLMTVVSTAKRGQVIVDGGSKTLSSDLLAGSSEPSFGYVVDAPQATVRRLNEEHGYVDVSAADRTFSIGDRLRVIPNHICVAMNLEEQVYGFRGDTVEEIWTVDARGKIR